MEAEEIGEEHGGAKINSKAAVLKGIIELLSAASILTSTK